MVSEEVDPVANDDWSRVGGIDGLYYWVVCMNRIKDPKKGAQDKEQSCIERVHLVDEAMISTTRRWLPSGL